MPHKNIRKKKSTRKSKSKIKKLIILVVVIFTAGWLICMLYISNSKCKLSDNEVKYSEPTIGSGIKGKPKAQVKQITGN